MTDSTLEDAFQTALNTGKINGAIICATDSTGQFSYNHTIGQRTLLSGEKTDHQLDDIVYLASATKLMATVAALTCVEDGHLTLEGDLSGLAPELTSKQVFTGFAEDDTPKFEAQTRPITMQLLLTHSSGMAYHFLNPDLMRLRAAKARPDQQSEKKPVEELFQDPLVFQPGTGWMYGPGLDWAGRIVERVTRKTLLEYLQERVFGRLGISDAQFYPVTREDLRVRMVDLNPDDIEGTGRAVLGGGGDMNLTTKGDFGGHGLFMTAQDYLTVLKSILANDGKILKRETVESMFENQLSEQSQADLEKRLVGPLGQFFRVGIASGTKAGYGFGGLLTMQDLGGWYGDSTLTWGGGRTFSWFIDRKNDLCGVCAVQAKLPFIDAETVDELKQVFRKGIYQQRERRQR